MQVLNLTNKYLNEFLNKGNRAAYESSFPELFDHYYRFWTKKEYDLAEIDPTAIRTRKSWLDKHLKYLIGVLDERNLDHRKIRIVYFIGVGTTNGHAFRMKDEFYVWIPLEAYTSKKLVEVFVTHELAHALHYQSSPSFYFESPHDKIRLSRLLITEGLATYLTRELMGLSDLEALWADYLNAAAARAWWDECKSREPQLFVKIADTYFKSDPGQELFHANDRSDAFKFRAGYYAGLKLVGQYAKIHGLTIAELLEQKRDRFERGILSLMQELDND